MKRSKKITPRQQGDLFFKCVDKIPEQAKKLNPTEEGYILARGEATGHMHRITEVESGIIEIYEYKGKLYVHAKKPVTVSHEEHKPVELTEGLWQVKKIKEYDHFRERTRRGID